MQKVRNKRSAGALSSQGGNRKRKRERVDDTKLDGKRNRRPGNVKYWLRGMESKPVDDEGPVLLHGQPAVEQPRKRDDEGTPLLSDRPEVAHGREQSPDEMRGVIQIQLGDDLHGKGQRVLDPEAYETFMQIDDVHPAVNRGPIRLASPIDPNVLIDPESWAIHHDDIRRHDDLQRKVYQNFEIYAAATSTVPPANSRHWKDAYQHVRTLCESSEGPLELVLHKTTGKQYVIKTVQCEFDYRRDRWIVPDEAAVLSSDCLRVQHPSIVSLVARHLDVSVSPPRCAMVTEYCASGDLDDLIEHTWAEGWEHLDEMVFLHVCAGMIDALAFLHEGIVKHGYDEGGKVQAWGVWERQENIIHRDIKTGNVFLKWDQDTKHGMPHVVLGDFGFATPAQHNQGSMGTLGFMAPEVEHALRHRYEPGEEETVAEAHAICSKSSDLYAFGATLYRLLTRKYWRVDRDLRAAFEGSIVAHREEIWAMMEICLQYDQSARGSIWMFLELSTLMKRELEVWYRKGGRIDASFWPEPLKLERYQNRSGSWQSSSRISSAVPKPLSVPSEFPMLSRGQTQVIIKLPEKVFKDSVQETTTTDAGPLEDMSNISGFTDEFCLCPNHRSLSHRRPGPGCIRNYGKPETLPRTGAGAEYNKIDGDEHFVGRPTTELSSCKVFCFCPNHRMRSLNRPGPDCQTDCALPISNPMKRRVPSLDALDALGGAEISGNAGPADDCMDFSATIPPEVTAELLAGEDAQRWSMIANVDDLGGVQEMAHQQPLEEIGWFFDSSTIDEDEGMMYF